MSDKPKDQLFMNMPPSWGGFQFDENVTRVFDDMLNRSIPKYKELQDMILELVDYYYQDGTAVFDLGCSLGTLLAKISMVLGDRAGRLVGIDNSEPMIKEAKQVLADGLPGHAIEIQLRDIKQTPIEEASVVIMNFTLQFIRPLFREKVLNTIFEGLKPGGILILSEKVIEDNPDQSKVFQDIYYHFKMNNGYTAMEIARKRECLEHVLVPYSLSEHEALLTKTGFSPVNLFFKWFNFASLIAVKPKS